MDKARHNKEMHCHERHSKCRSGVLLYNIADCDNSYLFVAMQEFFRNVQRYPRYLISFSLGVLYTFVEPLLPLLKRPVTAIALIGFMVGAFAFVTFTLRAMLGLNVA